MDLASPAQGQALLLTQLQGLARVPGCAGVGTGLVGLYVGQGLVVNSYDVVQKHASSWMS
jgi:hypothetical protein